MVPVDVIVAQGVIGQRGDVLYYRIATRFRRIFAAQNVISVGVLGAQEVVPGAEGDVSRRGGLGRGVDFYGLILDTAPFIRADSR